MTKGPVFSGNSAHRSNVAALFGLTRRETDVACLLVEGLANKQIARQLVVEARTVKMHIAALLRKTRTTNRTAAARLLERATPDVLAVVLATQEQQTPLCARI
jgi:DNA-binding NarL/FixJ family response regulator